MRIIHMMMSKKDYKLINIYIETSLSFHIDSYVKFISYKLK